MNALYRSGLLLLLLGLVPVSVVCQQTTPTKNYTVLGASTVTVAVPAPSQAATVPPQRLRRSHRYRCAFWTATTARIADPNEPVVFSGRVMRMADFVAAVSSSNAVVQRLHTPEMRNHETSPASSAVTAIELSVNLIVLGGFGSDRGARRWFLERILRRNANSK